MGSVGACQTKEPQSQAHLQLSPIIHSNQHRPSWPAKRAPQIFKWTSEPARWSRSKIDWHGADRFVLPS